MSVSGALPCPDPPPRRGKNDIVDRHSVGPIWPTKPTNIEHPNTRTHSLPRNYWASSFGAGGYHFPIKGDDWVSRRDAHLVRMYDQTAKAKLGKINFLEHSDKRDVLKPGQYFAEPGKEQKLTKYDINGFIYASSTLGAPPPEQNANPPHWVCQVNGTTNEYNIVNNLAPNPANAQYRQWEVRRFREASEGKTISAGSVQPPPVITCHEMPGFVPIRHKTYKNYSLVKPNL